MGAAYERDEGTADRLDRNGQDILQELRVIQVITPVSGVTVGRTAALVAGSAAGLVLLALLVGVPAALLDRATQGG